MRARFGEWFAIAVTLTGLIGIPIWVFAYNRAQEPPARRLIHLTGVMKDGAWTTQTVNSLNYGLTTFKPAEVKIQKRERVLFRLTSADVTHGFYVPDLRIGPVEIAPGQVVDVPFDADTTGTFTYYCTTVCGACHHFMRGLITIGDTAAVPATEALPSHEFCLHHLELPRTASLLTKRGRVLFQQKGCIACHGESGHGGVKNSNYIKDSVPRLDLLAERMHLYAQADADTVIGLLEHHADLTSLADKPPFEGYSRFLAQYESVREVIRDGKPAGRKDTTGVIPPLNMPSWEAVLSDADINALIAYLLTNYPWDQNPD